MSAIGIEITRRERYAGGAEFGATGAYERIGGTITFAVSPDDEANRSIVDLHLAPRDTEGCVQFRADFTLVTPSVPSLGNGSLVVDVANRGRPRIIASLNRAPTPDPMELAPGDGFLFEHGYSVVSIGWQWDVPRERGLLGLDAPLIRVDGQPVTGQSIVEIRPDAREHTRLLADRSHRPYPAADIDDPSARLLVRDYEDGKDTELARDSWRFARQTPDGIVPSAEHVYFEAGFEPGKIYNVVYTATNACVVGTGLLAVREIASFLRTPSELNPCPAGFERAIAYGVSQAGRLLRTMLRLGLNADEAGQQVFEGMLIHVAGARGGEFNHRFAQPSQQFTTSFGHLFPFADDPMTDPHTAITAGLLDRLRERGVTPRVIYTNTGAEYWRGDASLQHIDPTGTHDLVPAPETRIYHFAGAQHVAGSVPQQHLPVDGGGYGRYGANVLDYRPLLRAALLRLDEWITEGIEPPPSRHPRIDDGTAVTRDVTLRAQPIPGLATPNPDRLWVIRTVDLGPEASQGIGRYPVAEGATYAALVAAVDADGNELGGIRLPDLTVPVATHLPWNPRHPDTGAPEQIIAMQGSSHFFAATSAERAATSDPRLSIEERYASREAYDEQVRAAAVSLASERYLLPDDIDLVVDACATRYDAAVGVSAPDG